MTKQAISTPSAPTAIGPYSQAIVVNGLVFLSGQIGLDPATGEIVSGGVEAETRRVMQNLKAVLEEAGSAFDRVLKATIYLVDMNDFAKVNAIYGEHFVIPMPARATVAVAALPKGAKVEIDAIATCRSDGS